MYVGSPFWIGFILLGFLQVALDVLGVRQGGTTGLVEQVPPGAGLAFLAVMLTVVFAPKLFGVLDLLMRSESRRAYGGVFAILASASMELLFGMFLGPIMGLQVAAFMVALAFGRRIGWDGQVRDPARGVSWGEAWRVLWLPTVFGAAGTLFLTVAAPQVLPWALPVLGPWLLAVPFAVLTSRVGFGRFLARLGICATPEERAPTPLLRALA
jgi:membrane glycosyltransferase